MMRGYAAFPSMARRRGAIADHYGKVQIPTFILRTLFRPGASPAADFPSGAPVKVLPRDAG
jgi:hypothetical protein